MAHDGTPTTGMDSPAAPAAPEGEAPRALVESRLAAWLAPVAGALHANRACAWRRRADPADSAGRRSRAPIYYNIIRRGLLSWIGLQDTITRCGAVAPARRESDRRLPRRPLEPRCRRAVPARRSVHRRARAGSHHGAAGLAGAAPVVMVVAPWPVGAVWSLVPAVLKAYHGVNEIVTTLMMSFLGISVGERPHQAALRRSHGTTVPQTDDPRDRRPAAAAFRHHHQCRESIVGLAVILFIHWLMTRTAFGLRLRVVGANPQGGGACGAPARRALMVDGVRAQRRPRGPRRLRSKFSASGAMCGPTGTRPTA